MVCIRAGHGKFKDPRFNGWRLDAAGAKVLMIYHFVDKKDGSWRANADLFVKLLGGKRFANEVLVMDVESGSGAWTKTECQLYMDEVRKQVGGPPLMIYANQGYVTERGLGSLFTATHGWVAKWGSPGNDTSRPTVRHIAWQHAADGYGKPRVLWAGTDKSTDENRVDGLTQDQFRATLLGGSPPPPPAPPAVTDCSS